jgi:hypothetical protein
VTPEDLGNNYFGVENVTSTLGAFFRRCEAAKNAGGISKLREVEGEVIPPGWHYDLWTDYWIPPNVVLL